MFTVTSGVWMELSLGPLTLGLYGADCPAASAAFINLCRCKYFNGAVATKIIPEVAVLFSHPDFVYHHHLLAEKSQKQDSFWYFVEQMSREKDKQLSNSPQGLSIMKKEGCPNPELLTIDHVRQSSERICSAIIGEFSRAKQNKYKRIWLDKDGNQPPRWESAASSVAPSSVSRKGLLLAYVPSGSQPEVGLQFALTLSDRNMDFLEKDFMAIGEVIEGFPTIDRIKRAPISNQILTDKNSIAANQFIQWRRPSRIIRIKHTILLLTHGAPSFMQKEIDYSGNFNSEQSRFLSKGLESVGCFAFWAPTSGVKLANAHVTSAALRTTEFYGKGVSEELRESKGFGADASPLKSQPFVIVPEKAKKDSSSHRSSLLIETKTTAPVTTDTSETTITTRNNATCSSHDGTQFLESGDEIISVEYNADFCGDFLSSDDESSKSGQFIGGEGKKERERRRKEVFEMHREKLNQTRTLMLNILSGIPDTEGEIKPPENVLFVCRLNPLTTAEGLTMCFSQFGKVLSADVVYDKRSKNSLCYGFIEFEDVDTCYRAFQKMDNALIDDSRIHVDFSQSVSKLWMQRQKERLKNYKRDRE